MKKTNNLGFLLLSFVFTSTAIAACPGDRIAAPGPEVEGKMVVGSLGSDSWHEVHCTDGRLWDLKEGTGHPTDPSEFVGGWSAATNGQLVHSYGTDSYTYDLYKSGSNYCLQGSNGAPDVNITIQSAPTDACK